MTRSKQHTRVLIVDDEPHVATIMADSLKKLGDTYVFDTAQSGNEALTKLEQDNYSLLITDYSMPGMSGLDLAQTVRHMWPDVQVIVMSGYGTDNLQETLAYLRLDGYIDKPFTMPQIREVIKNVIERTSSPQANGDPYRAGQRSVNKLVYRHLKSLRINTGASCVMLLSAGGYPIHVLGYTTHLDISSISALVAANFMAAAELANLLGNNTSTFKSSYYEGNDYNIYSYDVNSDVLLAVIFRAESKPGVVWFYTKQTVAELLPLVEEQVGEVTFSEDDIDAALDAGFDDLLV